MRPQRSPPVSARHLLPLVGGQTWLLFLLALLGGGLMAAIAGLIVGVPSLRLKG